MLFTQGMGRDHGIWEGGSDVGRTPEQRSSTGTRRLSWWQACGYYDLLTVIHDTQRALKCSSTAENDIIIPLPHRLASGTSLWKSTAWWQNDSVAHMLRIGACCLAIFTISPSSRDTSSDTRIASHAAVPLLVYSTNIPIPSAPNHWQSVLGNTTWVGRRSSRAVVITIDRQNTRIL